MGPEVEYFPNVSAICGTLQRERSIILVPGSECQRTGRDRARNSRLAGGTSAPPLLGNHPGWGGNWVTSGVSGLGLWASVGDTQWASEGPVCSRVSVPVHFFIVTAGWWVRAQTLREGVQ